MRPSNGGDLRAIVPRTVVNVRPFIVVVAVPYRSWHSTQHTIIVSLPSSSPTKIGAHAGNPTAVAQGCVIMSWNNA